MTHEIIPAATGWRYRLTLPDGSTIVSNEVYKARHGAEQGAQRAKYRYLGLTRPSRIAIPPRAAPR